MKSEKVEKIARFCNSAEIQKWSSEIGRFYERLHPHVVAEMEKACDVCPFRNLINVGGCLLDDCPVHQVMHTMQRVVPRTVAATKEIYKAKFSRKSV